MQISLPFQTPQLNCDIPTLLYIRSLKKVTTIKASDTLEHQPTVWSVPDRGHSQVTRGSGSHKQLFQPCSASSARGLVFECVTCFYCLLHKITGTPIPAHDEGELSCGSHPTAPICFVWSWRLKGCFASARGNEGQST